MLTPIGKWNELHKAYLDARKHKRNTINQLKFERSLYVDDMVLIHSDKQVLLNAIFSIREFMLSRLRLTLHPKKIKL